MPEIIRLGPPEAARVVDVLSEAFFDYPFTRYVIGAGRADYGEDLRTLLDFFVMARILRGEWIFGITGKSGLDAVALVSNPGGPESPPEVAKLRAEVWARLGDDALKRYQALGQATRSLEPKVPHLHLNIVGVRRRGQGKGLGRALVERVQQLSASRPESEGVALNTEDPANVPLYEHLGFRVLGRTAVGPGLESWVFFRPD